MTFSFSVLLVLLVGTCEILAVYLANPDGMGNQAGTSQLRKPHITDHLRDAR